MDEFTQMKMEVIGQTIEAMKEIPAGELYAFICGGISLEEYLEVLEVLKVLGAIKEQNHLLTWIGNSSMFPVPMKVCSDMMEVSPEEYEQIKLGKKNSYDDKNLYGEFYGHS